VNATPVAWLRRFARTTPGVVVLIAAAVAASCIIGGLVAGAELDRRIAGHRTVLDRSEPVAYAAQNLYADLSAVDAAAAAAFLAGGVQTAPIRRQYQQALAGASAALVDASAGATDVNERIAVAEITAELATYTGLVEAARANNVQGFPIGSGYLREASSLMQSDLLPEAEKVFTGDMAAVDADQHAVGSTPIAGLVILGAVLAVLGICSRMMFVRTNRQFNLGLVIAALLVLVAIGWIAVATHLASSEIDHARHRSTARFGQLAAARILAQQGRTDETLQLIARGDITVKETAFRNRINDLLGRLGSGSPAVTEAVHNWTAAHGRQVQAYLGGDYQAAVAQAVGPDPAASAAQFAVVETTLREEIEVTRTALRQQVSQAGAALAWSPVGTLVLMTVAASTAAFGLWPRLKEFL